MRIGNDVVDLSDPETREGALHRRFDIRVFSSKERALIRSSADAHRARWAFWAAKESAYKLAKKLDSSVIFSPVQFKLTLRRNGSWVVDHQDKPIPVLFAHSRRCVHAIAVSLSSGSYCGPAIYRSKEIGNGAMRRLVKTPSGEVFMFGRARADSKTKTNPESLSRYARRQAADAIGLLLGISPGEIAIFNRAGIPRARFRDEGLPVDLSLSHHGGYVAYAVCYSIPISSTSKTNIPRGAPGLP
ncbi:MAG: 4-phosphopantetheinyl transferase family protein [Deltaproteobacteria bacterium]|nr:4-phosphopantetheinyl transferase family protein [Deltaproteobacteria bacterium]